MSRDPELGSRYQACCCISTAAKQRWFQDDLYHHFIVLLDDATSEVYYAEWVEEESTRTVMAALREVIEANGIFCLLYSDRGSHFFVTPKAGEAVDKTRLTQVGRAMRDLGIEMIPAYSPQARGRSERNFGTWQNRLPQEFRLASVSSLEEANKFLGERYISEFNGMFAKPAREKGTAFRKSDRKDLDQVFSIQTERTVAKDNTITIRERHRQLNRTPFRRTLADCICRRIIGARRGHSAAADGWGSVLCMTITSRVSSWMPTRISSTATGVPVAGRDSLRGPLSPRTKSDSRFPPRTSSHAVPRSS